MGIAAVLVAAATAVPSPQQTADAQQTPDAQQLLEAAGDYVRAAFPLLATVVATEEYVQERRVAPKANRRLRSEVLLVRHPTQARDWLFFRDVLDVDGVPLEDHQTRLQDLFLNPTVENWMLVGDIANASHRYHLDGADAGVTNPFVVVALLDRSYRARMQFKLGTEDPDVGRGAWTLVFQEVAAGATEMPDGTRVPRDMQPLLSPTLLARGTAWIDAANGRVLKTQLRLGDELGALTSSTTFRWDASYMVALPVEMKTTWTDSGCVSTGLGMTCVSASAVNGTATYNRFRRFGVQTELQPAAPVR